MKLRSSPLLINGENVYEHDCLERVDVVTRILNIIQSTKGNAVLSIEGRWGSGKTTIADFIKASYVKSSGKVVYYDAMKNDFIGNATVGILSSIIKAVSTDIQNEKFGPTIKGVISAGKAVGLALVKAGFGIGVRLGSGGMLNAMDVKNDIAETVRGDLSDSGKELAQLAIDNYITAEKEIDEFLAAMSDYGEKVSDETKLPLLIIIDELDRCRPDFAVHIFESIKYLFQADGVVVLMMINPMQIENTIRTMYGNNIDANEYMQKFIDVRLAVPDLKDRNRMGCLQKYIGTFAKKFAISDNDVAVSLHKSMSDLIENFNISLRDAEKIYLNAIMLSLGSRKALVTRRPQLTCVISAIRVKDSGLFNAVSSAQYTTNEVREFLRKNKNTSEQSVPLESVDLAFHVLGFLRLIDNANNVIKMEASDIFAREYSYIGKDGHYDYLVQIAREIGGYSIS